MDQEKSKEGRKEKEMKTRILIVITALFFIGACGNCVQENNKTSKAEESYKAVVKITCTRGTGSAFHIGEGVFVSAYHVTEGAEEVSLDLGEGSLRTAYIIHANEEKDLISYIISGPTELESLEVAEKEPLIGERVYAVGYHFGWDFLKMISTGIVSAKTKLPDSKVNLIVFDAAINSGCSGGPLLNSEMEVIGVNQRIWGSPYSGYDGVAGAACHEDLVKFLRLTDKKLKE